MASDSQKSHRPLPLQRISREWAMQFLYQLDIRHEKPDESTLAWFWRQLRETEDTILAEREWNKCKTRATALIHGVCEHQEAIDAKIDRYVENWDFKRLAPVDRNILRVAAFEICFDPNCPGPVSIDEALEIIKVFGGGDESTGLVNAILDRILNEAKNENKG